MKLLKHLPTDMFPDDRQGVYLVGGAVRDLLTGRVPDDIDLAVQGDIRRIAVDIVQKAGGRAIELGNKNFGVIRVVTPALVIDIAPLNGMSIETDLLSRDFTINAMAYDLTRDVLVDLTGGRVDIDRQQVRMVSENAFVKDPARLVRAYRMAALLKYEIEPSTREAVSRHGHRIRRVAGERVWSELVKIFNQPHAASIIRQMADDGLLVDIFPELLPLVGCDQNAHHQFDVFTHSLLTCQHVETVLNEFGQRFPELADMTNMVELVRHDYLIKYAALLHDLGKPATRKIAGDGHIGFPGHAGRGAQIVATISRRLKLSRREAQWTETIIRHHIRPLSLFLSSDRSGDPKMLMPRSRVRFFNNCGPLSMPILIHAMADIMAKKERLDDQGSRFVNFCRRLLGEYHRYQRKKAKRPPLISGNDLIQELGLSPSPQFKRILAMVDERHMTGALSSRREALRWVQKWLNHHRDAAGA